MRLSQRQGETGTQNRQNPKDFARGHIHPPLFQYAHPCIQIIDLLRKGGGDETSLQELLRATAGALVRRTQELPGFHVAQILNDISRATDTQTRSDNDDDGVSDIERDANKAFERPVPAAGNAAASYRVLAMTYDALQSVKKLCSRVLKDY